MQNRLKQAGFKLTPQRLAICQLILESKDHPSVEIIYALIKKTFPTISRATIYNTFHLLTQLEIIQEISFEEGKIRVDPNQSFHINLICTKCGTFIDYMTDNVMQHWTHIIKDLEITPIKQLVNIYYECQRCTSS